MAPKEFAAYLEEPCNDLGEYLDLVADRGRELSAWTTAAPRTVRP